MTENKTASGATTTTTTNTTLLPSYGYLSEEQLMTEYSELLKDPANIETAVNYLLQSLVDENILGVALEIHQGFRAGSSEALEGQPEDIKPYSITEMPNTDVFGTTNSKKTMDCNCPHCNRLVAAIRFAPHLESCMGMGRNSSRIASRRLASAREGATNFFASANSGDDDDDADWSSEKRKRKNISNMRANGSKKNGKS